MAKFNGLVGFAENTEVRPGVWQDVIVEDEYFGDVKRASRQLREGEYLNDDLTVGNLIEIMADAYAAEHFFAIRYVEWAGALWKVDDATIQSPRLVLRLGGVYRGKRGTRRSAENTG